MPLKEKYVTTLARAKRVTSRVAAESRFGTTAQTDDAKRIAVNILKSLEQLPPSSDPLKAERRLRTVYAQLKVLRSLGKPNKMTRGRVNKIYCNIKRCLELIEILRYQQRQARRPLNALEAPSSSSLTSLEPTNGTSKSRRSTADSTSSDNRHPAIRAAWIGFWGLILAALITATSVILVAHINRRSPTKSTDTTHIPTTNNSHVETTHVAQSEVTETDPAPSIYSAPKDCR